MKINDLTGNVIGAAIEVHKEIGPGLLESIYEECLCKELEIRKIPFETQKSIPIEYKGVQINCEYKLDIVVDKKLILELKACENLLPIHEAQLLTYLKLTGIELGLLINFNLPVLKDGIITPAIIYVKDVIPAQEGIQKGTGCRIKSGMTH
jgi:GxxExxY protein